MPVSTNTIIGGGFQNAEGSPLANGFLIMKLSGDEVAMSVGQIDAGTKIRVPLDSSGNVFGTVSVWPNDVIQPVNSYYTVEAYNANGQLVWGPQYQRVLSSPSPFDIGTWIPNSLNVGSQVIGVSSLNGETGIVNIVAGTGVTVTPSGQDIIIDAAGGGGALLLETNGGANDSQSTLNLVSGSGISVTQTAGNVTITSNAPRLVSSIGTPITENNMIQTGSAVIFNGKQSVVFSFPFTDSQAYSLFFTPRLDNGFNASGSVVSYDANASTTLSTGFVASQIVGRVSHLTSVSNILTITYTQPGTQPPLGAVKPGMRIWIDGLSTFTQLNNNANFLEVVSVTSNTFTCDNSAFPHADFDGADFGLMWASYPLLFDWMAVGKALISGG